MNVIIQWEGDAHICDTKHQGVSKTTILDEQVEGGAVSLFMK